MHARPHAHVHMLTQGLSHHHGPWVCLFLLPCLICLPVHNNLVAPLQRVLRLRLGPEVEAEIVRGAITRLQPTVSGV